MAHPPPPQQKERHYAPHLNEAVAEGVSQSTKLYNGRTAPLSLDIIIVGCGLGGLAAAHCLGKAGHKIRVVEQAPAIGEVGAGIQVTPNVSRLLIRWGLGEALKKIAVCPEAMVMRRYENGEKIGYTKWGPRIEQTYGSPYYHIHRADFHRLLLDLATPYMDLQLNTTVTSISTSPSDKPILELSDGRTLTCDLLIGADGVKSMIREYVLGRPDAPNPTGDAAYRATIPAEKLLKDPLLRELIERPEMTAWMGPQRHIMGYCIRGGHEYNLVGLHPDDGSVESWTAEGSSARMRNDFSDFEPRVRHLLSFIPTTLKWKLMDRAPLEKWIHTPSSRIVLLGDACHPMLPYRAQGAAMAIEDAAVLGNLFSRLREMGEIKGLLEGYFEIRYKRTSAIQMSSRLAQRINHLEDGPEQEERDRRMKVAMEAALLEEAVEDEPNHYNGGGGSGDDHDRDDDQSNNSSTELEGTGCDRSNGWKDNPNYWADREKTIEQFCYDADEAAEGWWTKQVNVRDSEGAGSDHEGSLPSVSVNGNGNGNAVVMNGMSRSRLATSRT